MCVGDWFCLLAGSKILFNKKKQESSPFQILGDSICATKTVTLACRLLPKLIKSIAKNSYIGIAYTGMKQ